MGQACSMYGKDNGKIHHKTGHECIEEGTATALPFL